MPGELSSGVCVCLTREDGSVLQTCHSLHLSKRCSSLVAALPSFLLLQRMLTLQQGRVRELGRPLVKTPRLFVREGIAVGRMQLNEATPGCKSCMSLFFFRKDQELGLSSAPKLGVAVFVFFPFHFAEVFTESRSCFASLCPSGKVLSVGICW